jgi:hypothetical protein
MKFSLKAALGAGLLALAGCADEAEDRFGDNVAVNIEAIADDTNALIENSGNAVLDQASKDEAEAALKAEEAKDEAVEEAEINAAVANMR